MCGFKEVFQYKGYLRSKVHNFICRDDCYTYLNELTQYFKSGTLNCSLVKLIDSTYPSWKMRYRDVDNGVSQFMLDNYLD